MSEKVTVEIRYAVDRCFCRKYECQRDELPKAGDEILLKGTAEGTVVNVTTYDDELYTVYVNE
jgi:hypothetical protein